MLNPEIVGRVTAWLKDAAAHPHIAEPTAMTLATATAKGAPSARVVLLKHFDARGFCFYTNKESRKGRELIANPQAALCFHWMPLQRQLRVEGTVEEVTAQEADEYFASRARESRLGAWASDQSRELASRERLLARLQEAEKWYEGKEVPRPPYWSGFRLIPESIEFWQEAPHRLHDRDCYTRDGGGWKLNKLYP